MYHRFSKMPQDGYVHREAFDKQVAYLVANHFNLMRMDELIYAYHKRGSFPVNSIVVTIDDGYQDFYDIAYPVLKKHQVSATFFVTSKFINGDFWLWPDSLRYILGRSCKINLKEFDGGMVFSSAELTDIERNQVWTMIATYLLKISEGKKIEWLGKLAEYQHIEIPCQPVKAYKASSWKQIKEMSENNIEIGAHTQTHPSLGQIDKALLGLEIKGSIDAIYNNIGRRPTSFCYPNGQPDDYTDKVKEYVKKAGCKSAVTAFYDQYINDDIFALRRFNVSENWHSFLRVVNGVDLLAAKYMKVNNIMYSCM